MYFTFGDGDVAAHVSVPQHSPEGYILQATSLQLREALQGDGLEADAASWHALPGEAALRTRRRRHTAFITVSVPQVHGSSHTPSCRLKHQHESSDFPRDESGQLTLGNIRRRRRLRNRCSLGLNYWVSGNCVLKAQEKCHSEKVKGDKICSRWPFGTGSTDKKSMFCCKWSY